MFETRQRARTRLQSEPIIWLTTVTPSGRPQTSPVWFLVQGDDFLVYSLPNTARVRNIEQNPHVALNLDGNGQGGDIVTIEGIARIARELPSAAEHVAYLAKYRTFIADNGWTPRSFADEYSVPILVTFRRGRAW